MEERCPLDDVLDMLRVRGAVMAYLSANAPWGIRLPHAPGATFHAVTAGSCWIRVPGEAPREMLTGDVVLLPAGAAHAIASDATGPTRAWDRVAKLRARNAAGELHLDGPGGSARIICAVYDYEREVAHPMLSLLPPTLFLSAHDGSDSGAVQRTMRML
jgi:hypothetical protein